MKARWLLIFCIVLTAALAYVGFTAWRSDELAGLASLSPTSTTRKIVEDHFTNEKYEIRKLTFTGEFIQKSREYLDKHLTSEKLQCTEQDDIYAVYKDPKLNRSGHEVYWFAMDDGTPSAEVIERTPISETKSKIASTMQKIGKQETVTATPATSGIIISSPMASKPISRSTADLAMAVRSNDLGEVKKALAAGGDPNKPAFEFDDSALLSACSKDDLTIARYLLQHGAKVNTTFDGEPIVCIVAARGYLDGARLLLENGAKLSKTDSQPLIECCDPYSPVDRMYTLLDDGFGWIDGRQWRLADQAVKLMIDSGVPVNGREPVTKQTALYKASASGHARIVKVLLDHGADPMIWDSEKKYPIDAAREFKRNNWRKVVTLLEEAMKKPSAK